MTLEIDPKVLDNVYNVDKTVLPQHLKVEEMLSDSHRNQGWYMRDARLVHFDTCCAVTLGVLTEDGDRWDSTTVGSLAIDGTVAKRLETKVA